ncbi:ATP-binding protein [Candidatus Phytoplasma fraxini]|uniref:ATPase, DUF234 domain-containing protein n=1 Tax=Ash yellows phytoplasma TaxID=35780 RepID=A0ABZ2U8F4_ASHYP
MILNNGAEFREEIENFLNAEVKKDRNYKKILETIASGNTKLNDIACKNDFINTGTLSHYIKLLMKIGLVGKEICFGKKNQKKHLYYIKDQFFNFYFKFIEKNTTYKIILEGDEFYNKFIHQELDTFVSYEFEKISKYFVSLKYRLEMEEIGRLWEKQKVIIDNKPKDEETEIDIILKTHKNLFAFECKWCNHPIDAKTIKKFKTKIKKLQNLKIDKIGFIVKKSFSDQNTIDPTILFFFLNDLYDIKLY